jgi:Protein of unknown function (DUF1524)
MVGSLDTVAGTEVKDYVRHYWMSRNGVVRSPDLFDAIKKTIKSSVNAVDLSDKLAKASVNYVALMNPDHSVWSRFTDQARQAVAVLNLLGIEQTRPFLLAAMENLSSKEASRLLVMAVSWSVRLLISGTQGSGAVETVYGSVALQIMKGEIKNASQAAVLVNKIVPKDDKFEADFIESSVSKSKHARYYLHSMERFLMKKSDPYFSTESDKEKINLEHIMPESRNDSWKHIPEKDYSEYFSKLGNQVLLSVRKNSKIGSESYAIKKPELASADFILTKEAASHATWDIAEIQSRQKRLAKLAVETWPLPK